MDDAERKRFEAWAKDGDEAFLLRMLSDEPRHYAFDYTELMWRAWQAAAKKD